VRGTPATIGGLQSLKPLAVEEERALYPLIASGRVAAKKLNGGRVLDGATKRRLNRERQRGLEAESQLLRSTLGLVRSRVTERGFRFGNEELEAAGVEALVNAIQRFEPDQGNRFATYANYWITKLVNQAIQQQVGLTDGEMRLVLRYQKIERSSQFTSLNKREIASMLEVSPAKLNEVITLSRELAQRRGESVDLDEALNVRLPSGGSEPPAWVIEVLREVCGDDFSAFWNYTFTAMSLDEIAKGASISRQAMTKRIERCRSRVLSSPEAARLRRWFSQQ
jgi:RNA polymerase sigma factor (sigma-70 family)